MRVWWRRLAVLAACVAACVAESGDDSSLYDIQHSFGSSAWSDRGQLTFTIDKIKKKLKLKFASNTHELAPAEVDAFKGVMAENGFYRVRIGGRGKPWLLASIPACTLAGNRFREAFRFHTDKTGSLLGFDYIPLTQVTNCDTSGISSIKLLSKASASLPKDAQSVPVGATMSAEQMNAVAGGKSPPVQGEGSGKGEEEKEPEQSFIRKYWYVFVPLALMSILAPPPPEEGQPQGVQGQGQGQRGGGGGGGGGGRKNK